MIEGLFLLVPVISYFLMFGIKHLSRLRMTDNTEGYKPFLRALLVTLSFIGVIATSFLNGTPVDPNLISDWVTAIIETGVAFLLAHGGYTLAHR